MCVCLLLTLATVVELTKVHGSSGTLARTSSLLLFLLDGDFPQTRSARLFASGRSKVDDLRRGENRHFER